MFVTWTEIQTVCGRSKGDQLEEVLKRGMSQGAEEKHVPVQVPTELSYSPEAWATKTPKRAQITGWVFDAGGCGCHSRALRILISVTVKGETLPKPDDKLPSPGGGLHYWRTQRINQSHGLIKLQWENFTRPIMNSESTFSWAGMPDSPRGHHTTSMGLYEDAGKPISMYVSKKNKE